MYTSMRGEQQRVHDHLLGAEREARQRPTNLDPTRDLVRRLLLDALAEYRERGEYPHNRDVPNALHPTFVDAGGVRCAMAHLLELGGAGALVAEVARDYNLAYVDDLAQDPRFADWLDAAGISVAEAARIQPSYAFTTSDCVCGRNAGMEVVRGATAPSIPWHHVAVLQVELVGRGDPLLDGSAPPWSARVRAIHGQVSGVQIGTEILIDTRQMGAGATPGQLALVDIVEGQELHPPGSEKTLTPPEDYTKSLFPSVLLPFGADQRTNVFCKEAAAQGIDVPSTDVEQQATARATGRAADCGRHLASLDTRWSARSGGDVQTESDSARTDATNADAGGGGCDVGTQPASASLGILLAIVGVLAARRAHRRV